MAKIPTHMIEAMLAEAEAEVAAALEAQRAATLRLEASTQERDAFRHALARRRSNEPSAEGEPAITLDINIPVTAENSFLGMPRTVAVEFALNEIVSKDGRPASPVDLETYFHEQGRDDSRDFISAALAHLNRTKRAHRVGYAQWMPGPGPENAESPASTGLSVVPAPTSDEGRTADADEISDRSDHASGWNDSHGRSAPSVMEG